MKKILELGLKELKQPVTADQLVLWEQYVQLLSKWNKVYNLSGVTDPNTMMIRHVLDSLCMGKTIDNKNFHTIADIGTGAGLPGIPLAILFPEKQFILVDSRQKRMLFLKQVVGDLNLKNVTLCHGRVEQLPVPANKPDVIMSRAFAKLADMLNLTKSWAKSDTVWFAMKGEISSEELADIPDQYQAPVITRLCPPFEKSVRQLVSIKQKIS